MNTKCENDQKNLTASAMALTMPDDMKAEVRAAAWARRISMNGYIRMAIQAQLEKDAQNRS